MVCSLVAMAAGSLCVYGAFAVGQGFSGLRDPGTYIV